VDGKHQSSQYALKAPARNNVYELWEGGKAQAGLGTGLGPVRRLLNQLHCHFVSAGFTQLHAIPMEKDILQVIRASRRQAIVLLTRQSEDIYEKRPFAVTLPGRLAAVLLACELVFSSFESSKTAESVPIHENRLICYSDLGALARVSEE